VRAKKGKLLAMFKVSDKKSCYNQKELSLERCTKAVIVVLRREAAQSHLESMG
jgi:hypothetical protein